MSEKKADDLTLFCKKVKERAMFEIERAYQRGAEEEEARAGELWPTRSSRTMLERFSIRNNGALCWIWYS